MVDSNVGQIHGVANGLKPNSGRYQFIVKLEFIEVFWCAFACFGQLFQNVGVKHCKSSC